MALGFRDSEALQVVLTSGLCPPEVAGAGARVAAGEGGALVLEPAQPLARAALSKLRALGVAVDAPLPPRARAVACWAEAVPTARAAITELPALVMFVTERAE
ncbi:MAG TPA: hypothetical protein VGC42_04510, partial [Kofleriaceae bacterium]